ncbi:MAG: hypothetical protein ABIO46_06995 [Chitinophagales bacterium]
MIEVFKTNVTHPLQASLLIDRIHNAFKEYTANFDLEDCDHILRIVCLSGSIHSEYLINFLKEFGCIAEILPDDDQLEEHALLQRELASR